MVDKITNQGGTLLVWSIKGFLKTVVGANTYRLKKSVDIDFDLSPSFELRFDDDGNFDAVANGDIGTFAIRLPLTSDVVSEVTGGSISTDDDKATLTYWFYELYNKRFPPVEFDEEMIDNQSTPKKINLKFKGIFTGFRKIRTENVGIYDIELSGVMKPDATADIKKT